MSKKIIKSILWRQVNDSTVKTLTGKSGGQYHITLTRNPDIEGFFAGLSKSEITKLGGYTLQVPIHAFEGTNPVEEQVLKVNYLGDGSARKEWFIPAQRPTTAYPLWRLGRGLPSADPASAVDTHYLVLVRDVEGDFHARWLTEDGVDSLPAELQHAMESNAMGVVHMEDAEPSSEQAVAVCKALREHTNVLLYGPPGTGKTHLMQEVVRLFPRTTYRIDTEEEHEPVSGTTHDEEVKVGWVTFHQSYSYEEFVIGLRPDPTSEKLLSLVPVPGLLLELAEHARQEGRSSLLIIDEINRGNVSRIFGEFITLLEADKRLADDGEKTETSVPVRLPYVKPHEPVEVDVDGKKLPVSSPFMMPRRLYTLASMNSVDKSVAPLDSALRRRFFTINLPPNQAAIAEAMGIESAEDLSKASLPEPLSDVNHIRRLAIALLANLNSGIAFYVGPEYRLGHWYLSPLAGDMDDLKAAKKTLATIWQNKLLPQLEELFQGRVEQLSAVLDLENAPHNAPLSLERPSEEMLDMGAVPYLKVHRVSDDDVVRFLRRIARVQVQEAAPDEAGGDEAAVPDEDGQEPEASEPAGEHEERMAPTAEEGDA